MRISKEARVAILAVVALAVLYFGFNYLKGRNFLSPNKTYYAVYQNVAGLGVSNPVLVSGVTVGRVSNINIIQGQANKIIVSIDVNNDIIVGDSAVALLTVDFLGSTTINLNPGKINSPVETNDTIIGAVDKNILDLLQDSAIPVADNITVTIRRINTILDNFAGSSNDIKSIITNFKETSEGTKKLMGQMQVNIDSTMGILNNTLLSVNDLTRQMQPLVAKYTELPDSIPFKELTSTLDQTTSTLKELQGTITKLNEGTGSASLMLNDDKLYNNLNKTIEDLDKLIIHFEEEPRHFLKPLGRKKKKSKDGD